MSGEIDACTSPIVFDACGMIEQVRQNPCTVIDKEICASHVISVWNAISENIIKQLGCGRAVKIPGFVTFTFKTIQVDLSQKEVIARKVPHMLVAGDLVRHHNLKVKRPSYNIKIPETMLNVSEIALNTGLSREHVQSCIDEVVQAYSRALQKNSHVEFIFPNIGRLSSVCREVTAVFLSQFLCLLGLDEEIITDRLCLSRVLNRN